VLLAMVISINFCLIEKERKWFCFGVGWFYPGRPNIISLKLIFNPTAPLLMEK